MLDVDDLYKCKCQQRIIFFTDVCVCSLVLNFRDKLRYLPREFKMPESYIEPDLPHACFKCTTKVTGEKKF